MRTIHPLTERILLYLFAVAAITVLHFRGQLQFQTALLLGAALTIIAVGLYGLWQVAVHKPYRVIIGIKYDTLCEDLRLALLEEQRFENFIFTSISAALFARSDEREYSTNLDVYRPIPSTLSAAITPAFIFRPTREGFQFGISVRGMVDCS
jgi:hypothetical protein